MKAREYRRKLKEVEGWNDNNNKARYRYWQDSMKWRHEAADHGSQLAKDEIQKELDESKTLNGIFSKVYSDHVDYSIDNLLDFLEPSANGEEFKLSFLESPCGDTDHATQQI